MRLGLAQWSYLWFLAPPDHPYLCDRDSLPYTQRGAASPYFLTTAPHISRETSDDPLEWFIGRCGQLGVSIAHCTITRWDDPQHLERLHALLDKHQLELVPSIRGQIIGGGDEIRQAQEMAIETIDHYRAFGGVRIAKFNPPMGYTRFSKGVRVDEILGLIKENIRPIVEAAREAGIILAFENHYDFRAKEIRSIIEDVNSPHLRSLLDVGSPFAVCEEPVDAAETLAPYVVLVHLKDVQVIPWTPFSAGYHACQFGVPLGEGNVDLKRIAQILAERAPDPTNLCLALESGPVPPHVDEDRWVVEGIAWMRRELKEFFDRPTSNIPSA